MDPLAVLAYVAEQALPLTGTGTGRYSMADQGSGMSASCIAGPTVL